MILTCGHCEHDMKITERQREHDTGKPVILDTPYYGIPETVKVDEHLYRCPNCLAQVWVRDE